MNLQDPFKQIGYLQQCLSSDKRPLGLFLGAGCPMAIKSDGDQGLPLIPDIAGITEAIRLQLLQNKECAPLVNIIQQHFSQDGHENVTIEDILSHIRALRVVSGKEGVRGLKDFDLDKLDSTICQAIQELSDKALP